MLDYRIVTSVKDLQRIVGLEIQVWGLNPIDAVPVNILALGVHNGGLVMVAEDSSEIVGFTVAFPARRGNQWILWSHMTGVHPDHQRRRIGTDLKVLQRMWAARNGYPGIGWTFDPLQADNAYLNLTRLGATAQVYHENFYGEMKDDINSSGLPSDRLEVYWSTQDEIVLNSAAEAMSVSAVNLVDDTGETATIAPSASQIAIHIPPRETDQSKLRSWQLALREAFQQCFAAGYSAYRFIRTNGAGYYLLKRLYI